ncbi:N-acetyltransferase [Vagococcus sp. DIV0080]|uniref:N-acetyltransferase n=1 Tax=Candidatus Vagococcus giribetii TaxID=2230876 RepID=A0ABS3HUR0_9ENTE|nr:GNAT family N-acetyltransferase [Vagococcus sp. DIV0080]MBO0477401.1 N-acetyltransferase [Vagococcus sp. DIV0080]
MKYVEEANRFVVYDDQMTEIGEMTWSNAGESMIIIDHTFVEDDQRGQGIAEQLVALGVDYARKNQKKVIPLCPFAKKEFDQKKDYQDVLKK